MRLLVINGPNLDLLGSREPEIYGSTTLAELEANVREWAGSLGVEVDMIQSNAESDLIEAIHASDHDGIVMNPGALTHTSRALADALAGVGIPSVEVHISNIMERESWRRESVLSRVAVKSIFGRGPAGYRDALRHHVNRLAFATERIVYGPHPDNFGDVRRGGSGLIVLVHGGFWRSEWTLDTMESLAVDLAQRGFNTWNIEYRRLGAGGGWPASAHDVLSALEFVPRLSHGKVTPTVIGHSAGGHLAIWAGPRARPPVGTVVGLAPLTDLEQHASSARFGAHESRLLLDQGAPGALSAEGVKVSLFHGTDDEWVPLEHSKGLLGDEGVRLSAVSLGHFELLDPSRTHWESVIETIT